MMDAILNLRLQAHLSAGLQQHLGSVQACSSWKGLGQALPQGWQAAADMPGAPA